MKIFAFICNEQFEIYPLPDTRKIVESCTAAALEEEGIEDDAEISVTLVDNKQIRELNAKCRGIDKETDVLSFPMSDENGYEINPDNGAIILGDIVVSLEKAVEQSKEYGHTYRREFAFLVTHSLFHLLGYDHVNSEEEEKLMFSKQEKVLEKLGITRFS